MGEGKKLEKRGHERSSGLSMATERIRQKKERLMRKSFAVARALGRGGEIISRGKPPGKDYWESCLRLQHLQSVPTQIKEPGLRRRSTGRVDVAAERENSPNKCEGVSGMRMSGGRITGFHSDKEGAIKSASCCKEWAGGHPKGSES